MGKICLAFWLKNLYHLATCSSTIIDNSYVFEASVKLLLNSF